MKYSEYMMLIKSFLDNKIAATKFKKQYQRLFLDDDTIWPQSEYEILNEVFTDLELFCADPGLRDPGDLDEKQLREKCRTALNGLSVSI